MLIIFLQQLGSDTIETVSRKSKKYRQGNYHMERDKTTNYNLQNTTQKTTDWTTPTALKITLLFTKWQKHWVCCRYGFLSIMRVRQIRRLALLQICYDTLSFANKTLTVAKENPSVVITTIYRKEV